MIGFGPLRKKSTAQCSFYVGPIKCPMLSDWRLIPISDDISPDLLFEELTNEVGGPGEIWFIFEKHLYLRLGSKALTWYTLKYGEVVR